MQISSKFTKTKHKKEIWQRYSHQYGDIWQCHGGYSCIYKCIQGFSLRHERNIYFRGYVGRFMYLSQMATNGTTWPVVGPQIFIMIPQI